jgi:hypothetical protein
MTRKPLGPIGQMEKGSTSDTQAVGSHRSDGDGERCCQVPQVGWGWRKVPSGPTNRMEKGPQAQVTHKPSGPTGRMEMEKGPTGTHDT